MTKSSSVAGRLYRFNRMFISFSRCLRISVAICDSEIVVAFDIRAATVLRILLPAAWDSAKTVCTRNVYDLRFWQRFKY